MRRMLTDKLTKSIKEVVNAYNEGEFSAVTANPETTTETLTAIEIDGTGYAVGGGTTYTAGTGIDITNNEISVDTETIATVEYVDEHSGSVDIDNKTIVENLDGELETAIGGYKEVTPGYTETVTGFTYSGTDFDITDAAEVNALFNKIKNFKTLTMTVTCGDGTNTYTPTVTFNNVSITSTKWNSNEENAYATNFTIQFYVDITEGSEKIHVWFGASPATITEVSEVSIEIPTVTEYHQIDLNYIYDDYEINGNYTTLSDDEFAALEARIPNLRFVIKEQNNKYYYTLDHSYIGSNWSEYDFSCAYNSLEINHYQCNYAKKFIRLHGQTDYNYLVLTGYNNNILNTDNSTVIFKTKLNSDDRTLGTVIGGGYSIDNVNITATDFTASGSNYTCSNTNFTTAFLQTIAYTGAVMGWGGTQFYFLDSQGNKYQMSLGWSKNQYNDYIEYVVDNSNISTFRVDNDLNLLTDPTTVEYSADVYDVLNNNSVVAFRNNYPQGAKVIETVDSKFLPAFNVAPTAAGTYVLKATVDAQGNVTYAWVAQV